MPATAIKVTDQIGEIVGLQAALDANEAAAQAAADAAAAASTLAGTKLTQATADTLYKGIAWLPAWTDISSKPTTLAGYGIGDAYTNLETDSAIDDRIADLIGTAPANLDTLQEIAAQLANDESAVSALTTTVSGKLAKASNLSDLTDAAAARSNLGLGSFALLSSLAFASLTGKPTTLAGYGITDAFTQSAADALYSALGHTHSFASLTSKPTTLAGYGITDAEPTIAAGTTSQYWRGDKSWQTLDKAAVGLGSVENTTLSTWAGSANINTLGTIGTGVWQGSAIADAYISSAATWNAKQAALGYTPVNKAGDTMSGDLSVPIVSSSSGIKITGYAGTFAAGSIGLEMYYQSATCWLRGYDTSGGSYKPFRSRFSSYTFDVGGSTTKAELLSTGQFALYHLGSATNDSTQDAFRIQPSGTLLANYRAWSFYAASADTVPRTFCGKTGDVVYNNSATGTIFKDSNGHYWRVTINTSGVLTTADLGTTLPT